MSTPRKPDLDQLVAALTADGQAEELAGRDAAVAAFRAASQRGAAAGSARAHRGWSFHRPLVGLPARLAAAGAALIVAAGAVAAAYAQALPGPAQELAHTVFAPLGVPANQSGHSADVTTATSGGTPSPRPGGDYRLTLSASRLRVPAGTAVAFAGRVTEGGAAAADVPVRLFERLAGTTAWQLVASGVTGPRGGFRLESPPLTATGVFRMVGPDAKHSAAVRVAVISPLPASRSASGARRRAGDNRRRDLAARLRAHGAMISANHGTQARPPMPMPMTTQTAMSSALPVTHPPQLFSSEDRKSVV